MEDNKLLQINPDDNVAIALAGLKGPGVYRCGDRMVRITEDIGPAHKVALRQIENGGQVIKYGLPIGKAAREIQPGEHVHIHNVVTNLEGLIVT